MSAPSRLMRAQAEDPRGGPEACGRSRPRRDPEAGSATVELAVLAPALLALLGLVIVGGRIAVAGSVVEQAASAAARSASLARDARSAQREAARVAKASLQQQGLECDPLSTRVTTSGFAVAVGRPATVSVRIQCGVALSDVSVPGMRGHRTVTANATSPLDSYRGRG